MILDICYAIDGDHVVATLAGNPHRLDWNRATREAYLDDHKRPVGKHLTEHAFHVEAATLFCRLDLVEHDDAPLPHQARGLRAIPADESIHGAGWGIACACGHFRTGWCATECEAWDRIGAHLDEVYAQLRHATSGVEERPTGDGTRYAITCACGIYMTSWFADELDARRAYGGHLIAAGLIPQQRSNAS